MRYVLVLVLAALLSLGFVLHGRKTALEHSLSAVATQLAERPVKVHCESLAGDLVDVGPHAGEVPVDKEGRFGDTTNLTRPTCNALRRFSSDVRSRRFDCVLNDLECDERIFAEVGSVKVLAHESWHLRGIHNEAETECRSMQTTADAARLLGADERHAQATAKYVFKWMYPHMSREYQTPECYNGGPLDLRPADPNWP